MPQVFMVPPSTPTYAVYSDGTRRRVHVWCADQYGKVGGLVDDGESGAVGLVYPDYVDGYGDEQTDDKPLEFIGYEAVV